MNSSPAPTGSRHRLPHAIREAIVIGRPVLVIHDEDREAVADVLADLLLENTSAPERAS